MSDTAVPSQGSPEANSSLQADPTVETTHPTDQTPQGVVDSSSVTPTELSVNPTEPTMTPTELTVTPTELTVTPTVTLTELTVTPTEQYVTPTEQYVTPTEQYVTPTEQYVTPTEQYVTPTELPVNPQDLPHGLEGVFQADSRHKPEQPQERHSPGDISQADSIQQPDLPQEIHSPEKVVDLQTDTRNSQAQAYSQFKERIGLTSTSCGDRYVGDLVAISSAEFAETSDNYLRGCKWSPDGAVLVTTSNDNHMRLFHLPEAVLTNQWDVKKELRSSLSIKETDTVFDFCWHPAMTSDLPETCLFATTCRETPIHLLSSVTGKLVASYRPYNHVDEIVAAHSIGFTSDGKYLVSGFNRTLRCFDTNRPGRECVVTATIVKEKDSRGKLISIQGQRSILSCFAADPTNPSLVAAGAFNGDVALYDVPSGTMAAMFEGQSGGITHVAFSNDGNYLFAGGRKNPEINCFDIRNPEKVLYVLYRHVATNQRMYFDLDRSSRYLLSGNHNGKVSVWDLQGTPHLNPSPYTSWPQLDPIINFRAHRDAVNGCSANPKHSLLATCSGQRHFSIDCLDEIVDMEMDSAISRDYEIEENTLKLWNLKLPR